MKWATNVSNGWEIVFATTLQIKVINRYLLCKNNIVHNLVMKQGDQILGICGVHMNSSTGKVKMQGIVLQSTKSIFLEALTHEMESKTLN